MPIADRRPRRPGVDMKTINVQCAVAMIHDGATLMIGGYMGCGTPEPLMDELVRQGKRNLTIIANDLGLPEIGIGKLLRARLVDRAIVSHVGLNPEAQRMVANGELDVELVPQGTLIERIRAGGCALGGVLTQTGVGTIAEKSKQKIDIDGRAYLIEKPLRADFALVAAFACDCLGNLTYALAARNFNPVIATAADTVIVCAEHVVPLGGIAPDHVVTPAPLVDYL